MSSFLFLSPYNRGPFKIFISDVSLCSVLPTHPTHPPSRSPLRCLFFFFFSFCLLHPKCYTTMTIAAQVCVCDKHAEQNCLYLPVKELAVASERRADARKSFLRNHRRRLAWSPGGRPSLPLLWGGGLFHFILSCISHSCQAREWWLERERERERKTQTSREEEILGFVSKKTALLCCDSRWHSFGETAKKSLCRSD